MPDCRDCQMWEDNCICPKCPNCKEKDYSNIRNELIQINEYDPIYKKIKTVYCNNCSNIFGIRV